MSEIEALREAVARVRALETFSITDSYPAWTAVDHDDLLAALDGAPEPVQVDEAALIREAKAEALEEKGYFLKGHAEWTRSNFLPGPHSDACAKYNDEIGDELIEDAAELRARAAEYRKAVGS